MTHRALVPPHMQSDQLGFSPGVLADGFVFVSGMTGSAADGTIPDGIVAQTDAAFAKIGAVLAEADLELSDIVEISSFHVGLRAHFDAVNAAIFRHCGPVLPAWTAVEVPLLRREGALIELRAIARAPA